MSITTTQFRILEDLFTFYNIELFDGQLPDCLVNLTRHKGTHGLFSPERWKAKSDKSIVHEISLNPDCIHRSDIEWHSTLVHEMVHLWQQVFGKPSRSCYHNTEWAKKMETVGLMPTNTGAIGGKKTGERMTHYIIKHGKYENAFYKLTIEEKESLKLKYLPNINPSAIALAYNEDVEEKPIKKQGKKIKYSCECGNNVWGKSGLKIICQDCAKSFSRG